MVPGFGAEHDYSRAVGGKIKISSSFLDTPFISWGHTCQVVIAGDRWYLSSGHHGRRSTTRVRARVSPFPAGGRLHLGYKASHAGASPAPPFTHLPVAPGSCRKEVSRRAGCAVGLAADRVPSLSGLDCP